ncbi:hypothetical protein OG218_06115 [Kineococcus sp. NBC_00420]|uniref:hypothetical protein n=1 Tax=Kineococcus sp. NBC_00420 TaxID=2903564 RepID=UPI002E1B3992
MSYDIVLSAKPEEDPDAGSVALNAERLAQWERIQAELRESLPGPVESGVSDTEAQLTCLDHGLQVSLFAEEAFVSFPYWEQEDSAALHAQVRAAVAVVSRITGWRAWDPQTNAPFNGIIHDGAGLRAIQELGLSAAERRSLRGRFWRWLVCGLAIFCISAILVLGSEFSWRSLGVVLGPLYVANALRLRRRLTSPPGR